MGVGMKSNKIIFTNVLGVPDVFNPKPSTAYVPEWYKELPSYYNPTQEKKPDGDGTSSTTVKRCMPLFDATTAGYIIPLYSDVYVSQRKNSNGVKTPWYEWSGLAPVQFHPAAQAPNYPNRNGHDQYPKWMSPWAIKTPPGYSALFTQPFHRESVFTILDGIVDTDKYNSPVNFPFVLNDINFEGLIPSGTPIAQIIPFKRESWKMELGSGKEIQEDIDQSALLRTRFFDSYKTFFRSAKEYK
jgi:hypothetical protein